MPTSLYSKALAPFVKEIAEHRIHIRQVVAYIGTSPTADTQTEIFDTQSLGHLRLEQLIRLLQNHTYLRSQQSH
ncbi:hypothetical protein WAI453_008772 [Rhynchosporium graminicola]